MSVALSIAGSCPNDFPDWLSPLTVKELRQGLRSKSFLVTFLLAQLGMSLLTVGGTIQEMMLQNSPQIISPFAEEFPATMKATLFMLLVCGLLPLRSWFAMREEGKGGCLELVILAGSNPQRLVMGKWTAHLLLMLVLSLSALPYNILVLVS